MSQQSPSLTARIIDLFLTGNLSPLIVLLSIVAGAAALMITPREEEPQIVVPLADVHISAPGATPEEIERLIATRLERLLLAIPGVEYVYSTCSAHGAIVTVRFKVGEDRERSLVKLNDAMTKNIDLAPSWIDSWIVKPIEIDDVSILALTFTSAELDDHALRRIAEEFESRIVSVAGVGRTEVIGGRPRQITVQFSSERLAAHGVSLLEVQTAVAAAADRAPIGSEVHADRAQPIVAAGAFAAIADLADVVVATRAGAPVYLGDVVEIQDGPEEPSTYTRFAFGRATSTRPQDLQEIGADYPAVTLAVAKQKGANAVTVAHAVRERVDQLAAEMLPDAVHIQVTRDHGATADHKVDELVEGLAIAIIAVILLISLMLGWREGLIVALAVPITFSLTLLVNWMAGYSINRVTLFALTLALGLVVDDPIVDVENIFRHLKMKDGRSTRQKVLDAVNQVRPPIILATLAVILSFLPLFGITGMMGPYMAPMALNVPLAMLASMFVAFTITPWLAHAMLARHVLPAANDLEQDELTVIESTRIHRIYSRTLSPFLASRKLTLALLVGILGLFVLSGWLAASRRVPLKLLPYDDKSELTVMIDLPEGTTLERTEAISIALADLARGMPEVTDVTTFVGVSGPMDFNSLVRHYYLRHAPHQGEIRVNLVGKFDREHQSHQIALRLRALLTPTASAADASIAVVEFPPGPPVIATITAEVIGSEGVAAADLDNAALSLAQRLRREPGVVDVDTTVEAARDQLVFALDREKAALHGIDARAVRNLLAAAASGQVLALLDAPRELNELEIVLRTPLERRSAARMLGDLSLPSADGGRISLAEIGTFRTEAAPPTRYRKNARPLAYVFAETAGRAPAEVILDVQADLPAMPAGVIVRFGGEGEWKITLDVFRDLGIAFFIACLCIYILLVYETSSYLMPLILMTSIPLTVIGIVPGFYLLNLLFDREIAGAQTPVFFTATAMIGMIALAGIAVRNSILLVDFIQEARARGVELRRALLASGAVRLRPIALTAGTAMLAAIPITLDPIFSGLAWALIFGLLVSTGFTLLIVPLLYEMIYGRGAALAANQRDR